MGEKKRRRAVGDMESFRFEQGPCLNCGKRLNGLTGPKGGPEPGSIMVCAECSYVMEWDGSQHVELTAALMTELSADQPELSKALALTKALQELRAMGELRQNVRVIMLEPREPEICEACGKLEELRPYGKKKADGQRMWVCMPCAEKDPDELHRAFDERLEGENPV